MDIDKCNKKLWEAYKECQLELASIGIQSGNIKNVVINSRAMKRFGCCHRDDDGYIIEVSKILLADNVPTKSLYSVIIHELLHSAAWNSGHTGKWRYLADCVNNKLGYHISRTSSYKELGISEPETTYKYVFVCSKCGAKVRRMRHSKFTEHPERYICSKCGGKFVREEEVDGES